MRLVRRIMLAALVLAAGCKGESLGTAGAGGAGQLPAQASGAGGSVGGPAGMIGAGGRASSLGGAAGAASVYGRGGASGTAGGAGVNIYTCLQNSDCGLSGVCWPQPSTCGGCAPSVAPCADDSDCAGDAAGPLICEQVGCDCATQCHPGCVVDADCDAASICGPDHRCVPAPCGDAGNACPTDFTCGLNGQCERKSCIASSECSRACLQSRCYGTPGVCAGPLLE